MISCIIAVCGKCTGPHGLISMVLQLKNQTYKDIEIIPLVCCVENVFFLQKLLGVKIYDFPHEKHTQNEKNNLGIGMAKGKYIGFFSGDDYYTRDYLEKMVNRAESETASIVYCNFRSHYGNYVDCRGAIEHGHISTGSFIVRRDVAEMVGGFSLTGRGDFDFANGIKNKGLKTTWVNEMLYVHR